MSSLSLAALKSRYRQSVPFRWAVDLTALVVLLSVVGLWQTRKHPRGAAPAYTFTELVSGTPTPLSAFVGKPTIVAVWAPWCGVCKAESDNVSRARRWLGDRANVISVATQFEQLSQVHGYVKNQNVDYPVYVAGDDFSQVMHVGAFPTTFVLDSKGQVVSSAEGYTTTFGLLWRAWWAG